MDADIGWLRHIPSCSSHQALYTWVWFGVWCWKVPKEVDPDVLCVSESRGDFWRRRSAVQLAVDIEAADAECWLCGKWHNT